jgi:hypothetical protein
MMVVITVASLIMGLVVLLTLVAPPLFWIAVPAVLGWSIRRRRLAHVSNRQGVHPGDEISGL